MGNARCRTTCAKLAGTDDQQRGLISTKTSIEARGCQPNSGGQAGLDGRKEVKKRLAKWGLTSSFSPAR